MWVDRIFISNTMDIVVIIRETLGAGANEDCKMNRMLLIE